MFFCPQQEQGQYMKLEPKITNNHSSLIDNQSKRRSTPVENVRQINLFMQNKPKVKYAKINVSSFVTSKYVQHGQLVIQTNKAKTNPIQTQTKPILAQYQGCQSQNKPNQSQFRT